MHFSSASSPPLLSIAMFVCVLIIDRDEMRQVIGFGGGWLGFKRAMSTKICFSSQELKILGTSVFFFFVLSFEIQAYTNILSPVLEIGRRKAALVGGETVKGLFS